MHLVPNVTVLAFRYDRNDPITSTNVDHIKGAMTLNELARIRPDERGLCKKLWDCLGPGYNGITKQADVLLWQLLGSPIPADPLDLFEALRDTVTDDDREKFVYLSIDRDSVRFSLEDVDTMPVDFKAAPQGIPARITANLLQSGWLEQRLQAQDGQSNLNELLIYREASAHIQSMLNKLASPATYLAIARAVAEPESKAPSTGMVHAEMPEAGPHESLLAMPEQPQPKFSLSVAGRDLIRAEVSYQTAVGQYDVSFLVSERAHADAPVEDTLQCIFTKLTPRFP